MKNLTTETSVKAMILALVAVFVTSCIDVCEPVDKPQKADIIFSATAMGNDTPSIFGMKDDGTTLRELLKNAKIYAAPDTKGRFACLRNEGIYNAIIIANVDGDSLFNVTPYDNTYPIEYILLSPKGGHVISFDGESVLRIYDITGSVINKIPSDLSKDWLPAFSPDDEKLAIVAESGDIQQIIVYHNLSKETADVFMQPFQINKQQSEGDYKLLSWSRDSKYLVWTSNESDTCYINILNAENSTESWKYPIEGSGARQAEFSHSDDELLFTGMDKDIYRMWDFTTDTLKRLALTNTENLMLMPKWSGNGKDAILIEKTENDRNASGRLVRIKDVLDHKISSREPELLFNRVNRAFWNINQ